MTASSDLPGRSHFDYCVNFIVGKLDDAARALPATRPNNELGRATSTMAKALKARILLYAASPLWNGSFPNPEWKNKNYETDGYGNELVSSSYDREKWTRALTACQEALTAAKEAGYQLFDIETANKKADRDGIALPFIPGREEDTEENREFKERVRMFQYMVTANEGDNNKELIWAQRIELDAQNGGEGTDCRLPNKVVKRSNGVYVGGWAAMAPTLYSVQHFYTENGKLPAQDPNFYPEEEWYTRFYEGAQSPALATNNLDGEDVKNDIIKMHAKREARFYAWIVFDGTQYSSKINNGNPLWINLKNTNTNGYNTSNTRNCAGSGMPLSTSWSISRKSGIRSPKYKRSWDTTTITTIRSRRSTRLLSSASRSTWRSSSSNSPSDSITGRWDCCPTPGTTFRMWRACCWRCSLSVSRRRMPRRAIPMATRRVRCLSRCSIR